MNQIEDNVNDLECKFITSLTNKECKLIIETKAFNKMCNSKVDKNGGMIYIKPLIYYRYLQLQLVWRDVLEMINNKNYKPKNIQLNKFIETENTTFFALFIYNEIQYYTTKKDKMYTICLTTKEY